jgi:hypothetical protein
MISDDADKQEQREQQTIQSEGKGCLPKGDRPLTWSELRDRAEAVEATEEVPAELRGLWSRPFGQPGGSGADHQKRRRRPTGTNAATPSRLGGVRRQAPFRATAVSASFTASGRTC